MPKSPATHDSATAARRVPFTPPGLNPQAWDRAAGRLLAKMLGEFAYEEIIEPPGPDRPGRPTATAAATPSRSTTAAACPSAPGAARTAAGASIRTPSTHEGRPFTDPLAFLARARRLLALDGATLGHLIRELTATLAADTRLDHTALTAAELADLGYAELEGHQTGHPWLVAQQGPHRLLRHRHRPLVTRGPQARPAALDRGQPHPRRLPRRPRRSPDPDDLYARELDAPSRESFAAALRARGLDPARRTSSSPCTPGSGTRCSLPLFAPAIAAGDIVPLPTDGDLRLPQQSIRTFVNLDRADRHTVKLPLSILNTLVWRGLPTERTLAAPAVTAWVHGLRDADPFLRDECGVILLGEVASVTVEHPLYDHLPEVPYQYKELLGAIWREPLQPRLAPGERARTLASLLHTDPRAAPSPPSWSPAPGWPPPSGSSGSSPRCCRRCCTSSTATAPSSPRTARTPSSSSTTRTSRYASRSRTSSTM